MAVVRLSYTPAETGATVTAVRLFTTPDRTGLPVFSGVPVVDNGVWSFAPDLTDGPYYSEFDVTDSTGSYTDGDDFFYVLRGEVAPGSSLIDVAEVRARLNKDSAVDDPELVRMIGAAVSEYAEVVGPVGSVRVSYYGGPFPRYAANVVITDDAGNVVDPSGYTASPYLRWDVPAGIMGHGWYRSLTISYTASLPANHREAIIADVAGYFSATQRGPAALPGEGFAEGFTTSPLTLFPRIKALASSAVA